MPGQGRRRLLPVLDILQGCTVATNRRPLECSQGHFHAYLRGIVKLMSYHQTKDREADTVINVFRTDDNFWQEGVPFFLIPQQAKHQNLPGGIASRQAQ